MNLTECYITWTKSRNDSCRENRWCFRTTWHPK